MNTGYSGTPLWKKLGLEPGMAGAAVNAPGDYHTRLIRDAPPMIWGSVAQGVRFVHLFTVHRAELEQVLTQTLPLMAQDGMIWVSWPKKAAKVPTDVTEDTIRAVALPMGLVDIKVCAVDEIWSGLKLVIRKDLRQS